MVRKELGKNPTTLGRALVKSKATNANAKRKLGRNQNAVYHYQDHTIDEEKERLKLESVMERNSLDEFLTTAMMKEQDFTAQRANVIMVGGATVVQVQAKSAKEQLEYEHIRIPRRPQWEHGMTAEELTRRERESFLEWRRELAKYEESAVDKTATPFEKNPEVWKQLWRVAERSHVIAQIVDARNPLLFYCQDLVNLTHELDKRKRCVLVINKSDFLTRAARKAWARYFEHVGIDYVFWSAKIESDLQAAEEAAKEAEALARARVAQRAALKALVGGEVSDGVAGTAAAAAADSAGVKSKSKTKTKFLAAADDDEAEADAEAEEDGEEEEEEEDEENGEEEEDEEDGEEEEEASGDNDAKTDDDASAAPPVPAAPAAPRVPAWQLDRTAVVGHEDLLSFLKSRAHKKYVRETFEKSQAHDARHETAPKVVVGMLGFPNVGKSSTINALIGAKKVSVAATPGHTKHFQTLNLGDDLMLCDCPGLVFPTFVHDRSTLVVNGVIPIDTLKDYMGPVDVICRLVHRSQFIQAYGLDIPSWKPLDALTMLTCHARMRGFFKDHGQPDQSRSARLVLKDFVAGKLLYAQCPPGLTAEERTRFYKSYTEASKHAEATTAALNSSASLAIADGKAQQLQQQQQQQQMMMRMKMMKMKKEELAAKGAESATTTPNAATSTTTSTSTPTSTSTSTSSSPQSQSQEPEQPKLSFGIVDVRAAANKAREEERAALSASIHAKGPSTFNASRKAASNASATPTTTTTTTSTAGGQKGKVEEEEEEEEEVDEEMEEYRRSLEAISLDGTTDDVDVDVDGGMMAGPAAGSSSEHFEVAVTRKKITKVTPEEETLAIQARQQKEINLAAAQSKKELFRMKKALLRGGKLVTGDVNIVQQGGRVRNNMVIELNASGVDVTNANKTGKKR